MEKNDRNQKFKSNLQMLCNNMERKQKELENEFHEWMKQQKSELIQHIIQLEKGEISIDSIENQFQNLTTKKRHFRETNLSHPAKKHKPNDSCGNTEVCLFLKNKITNMY